MPVYGIDPDGYADGGLVFAAAGRFPSKPVETAIVLGGGGNRGAAQVGMLRALVESGVVPELIVGTSIGAVNGAAFAGSPTIEGVYLAADVWRRIGVNDVFTRGRFHGSWRYLERRPSVFSMDRLRSIVASYLRFEVLEESPVPLLLIATRLDDGREEWFTEGPAVEAIMASAALPGLYPAVEIAGRRYFDGGVLDNVGLSAALACGAKRIYVLLCGKVDAPPPSYSRPFEAMFSAFTLALGSRLRRDLAVVPPAVDVVVVELPGAAMFDPQDFSRTDDLLQEGYELARLALDDYAQRSSARGRLVLRRRPPRWPQWPKAVERAEADPPESSR